MNDRHTTRMLLATAALAAVAALYAGPAGASPLGLTGDSASTRVDRQTVEPGTIPYLSQGIGVDESYWNGQPQLQPRLTGVHAALEHNRSTPSIYVTMPGIDPAIATAIEARSSAADRTLGLTGDSASSRYPELVSTPAVSGGDDIDWASFGAGAGLAVLLAAGLAGGLLAARRRHTVGLP